MRIFLTILTITMLWCRAGETIIGDLDVTGVISGDGSGITNLPAATAVWGAITGTLADQTDLQDTLDLKAFASDLTTHVNNVSNPHNTTAVLVPYDKDTTPTFITATDVQGAIDQSAAYILGNDTTANMALSKINTHEADLANPHAVTFAQIGDAPNDGQDYVRKNEAWAVASGGGGGAVDSVFGRTGIVEADASDYTAAQVDFVPAGNTTSDNVQLAIQEVQTDLDGDRADLQDHEADLANPHAVTFAQIGDAPNDGQDYVRKNEAWAVASSGGGTAAGTTVDASVFFTNLSATDTDVQTALETIDALSLGGGTPVWELDGGVNSFSAVGAGAINASSDYSILAGRNNYISSTLDYNAILCGGHPTTAPNYISGGTYNVIVGGLNNYMSGSADQNFIGGGNANRIYETSTDYGVIGGGASNYIRGGSSHGSIGGGQQNYIYGPDDHGTVGGGTGNGVHFARAGVIAGGDGGFILSSDWCGILGGEDNDIKTTSHYSAILGGRLNIIDSSSTYSSILGGYNNEVNEPYGFAMGNGSEANSQGAVVFSDSASALTVDGGVDSITLNYAGGLDMVPVTVEPASPAAGRVTLFFFDDGASTFSLKAKFSDGAVNTVTTHTVP